VVVCSRYNLAKIKYHPALKYSWLYTSVVTDRDIELEVAFIRVGGYMGGRLAETLHTQPGQTYIVDRDATVMGLGGVLYVEPGTTLEFSNALGMLVEGYVHFMGTADHPVTLRLQNESTWVNNTRVRLVDGPSLLEGRLEVRPTDDSDDWGTICRDVSPFVQPENKAKFDNCRSVGWLGSCKICTSPLKGCKGNYRPGGK